MKPGYKTSEFWFTLVSFIFSGLFLIGVIKEDQTKEELISVISHGVESVILIGGQVLIFYRYMKSREKYKDKHIREKEEEYEEISKELENYVGVDKVHDKININEASIGELLQLPHIGPSLAKKIIEHRKENGNFNSIQDITLVNGIGSSIYEQIKNYIVT